jgi:phenylalanine-4-hydroxylase
MQTIELDAEHPGFRDPMYRVRRDEIAALSTAQVPGQAPPLVHYTDDELLVWQQITAALDPLHERHACAEYLAAKQSLALPRDEVPQLRDLDERLRDLSGCSIEAVPGLLPGVEFFRMLARRCFPATQYLRHRSTPLYTPEPDMAHELIGHVVALASPTIADLYQRVGQAALRARSAEALALLGNVYWFTFEFGVCRELGEPKAYGAGLLSSYGELMQFRDAELVPFDVMRMAEQPYAVTEYQRNLFVADHFDDAVAAIERFLAAS